MIGNGRIGLSRDYSGKGFLFGSDRYFDVSQCSAVNKSSTVTMTTATATTMATATPTTTATMKATTVMS